MMVVLLLRCDVCLFLAPSPSQALRFLLLFLGLLDGLFAFSRLRVCLLARVLVLRVCFSLVTDWFTVFVCLFSGVLACLFGSLLACTTSVACATLLARWLACLLARSLAAHKCACLAVSSLNQPDCQYI